MTAEPLLIEARLLTMQAPDGGAPSPGAVACAGGRIVAVGSAEACARALPAGARRVASAAATLLPGFIDAHVHILAAAAAEAGPDCSPRAVASVEELLAVLEAAAAVAPSGAWVRAYGYEETMLAELRPPTRAELDRVVSRHPLRLIHRSGHAEVLNSAALALLGVDEATSEPPGAVFGRSLDDGRLDGLLIGMGDAIEAAMPPPDGAAVEAAVGAWARARAAEGVTTFVDAGARNGPAEWETLCRLMDGGVLPQRAVMMEPLAALGSLPAAGAGGRLVRGESKVQPAALEGQGFAVPPLAALVGAAVAAGRRVAVHAPTAEAVASAVEALRAAGAPPGQRLEHAPLLDEGSIAGIAEIGAAVVGQPGLLREVAPRYERLLSTAQRARLQPWRAVRDAGIALAFSTDAPVSRAGPLLASAAASVGRPETLAPEQAMRPLEALQAWTVGAAEVARLEDRGRLRVGQAADLVLVDGPVEADPGACTVRLTLVAGAVVHGTVAD